MTGDIMENKEISKNIIRKRPPSYYRYKKEHPTISFTLTKQMKNMLDSVRGIRSYGRAVQDIMTDKLNIVDERIKQLEENLRIKEGKIKQLENALITCPCPVCGEDITVPANSGWHEIIKKFLKERGWKHVTC